jgi:hypothetical protein
MQISSEDINIYFLLYFATQFISLLLVYITPFLPDFKLPSIYSGTVPSKINESTELQINQYAIVTVKEHSYCQQKFQIGIFVSMSSRSIFGTCFCDRES